MKLHDSTRRFVSLLIFFLLGPILTFGILAGIVSRKMPGNARKFEHVLSIQTGLDWKIEAVEYRSPDCLRLKNVRLLENISLKPFYDAPEVDLVFQEAHRQDDFFPDIESPNKEQDVKIASTLSKFLPSLTRRSGFWKIIVRKSTLRLDQVEPGREQHVLPTSFFRLLSRFQEISEVPIQFAFDEIDLISPPNLTTGTPFPGSFRFVSGNLYRTGPAIRSEWSFQIPMVSETETQRLVIELPRNGTGFDMVLQTQKEPIPCRLAALFCPEFERLGPGSLFSGEISGHDRGDRENGRTVTLRKAFVNNLDLARFATEYATEYTPQKITGTVDMNIEQATFSKETFTAEGWINIKSGSMDRNLFRRLVDRFALKVHPPEILDAPLDSIPFDICNINFRLQPEGIVFWSNHAQNVFMTRRGDGIETRWMYVFFTQKNMLPISYYAILSIFAPDSAPVIPLTPGIQKIVSFLPSDAFATPERRRGRGRTSPEDDRKEMLVNTSTETESLMQQARQRYSNNSGANVHSPTGPEPIPAPAAPMIADPWRPSPFSRHSVPSESDRSSIRPLFRDPDTRSARPSVD